MTSRIGRKLEDLPSLLLAASLALVVGSGVWAAQSAPPFLAVATLADPDRDYDLWGAVADGEAVFVGMSARWPGDRGMSESLAVGRVAPGAAPAIVDVPIEPSAAAKASPVLIRRVFNGMVPGGKRDVLVALGGGGQAAALARVEIAPPLVSSMSALDHSGIGDPQRMIQSAQGRMLLFSNVAGALQMSEIADDGSILQTRKTDAPELALDDAQPTREDGAIVVGRRSETGLVVLRMSATGHITSRAEYPGRSASITQTASGFALVHAEERDGKYDLVVRGLDVNLREVWRSVAVGGEAAPHQFAIQSTGQGVVVSGSERKGLWLAMLDSMGAVRWRYSRAPSVQNPEIIRRTHLVRHNEEVSVVYSAFLVDGREQRSVVRVQRFAARTP